MNLRLTVMLPLFLVAASACARQVASTDLAPTSSVRAIDEPCSTANTTLAGAVRSISLPPMEFKVPKQWVPDWKGVNDVDFNLIRTGSTLHVWKGSEFIFLPVLPLNTASCEITVENATVKIRTTMLQQGITTYRADVSWALPVGGQYVYMQLLTRYPEHLRQLRGVIEGVRFPVSTAANAAR